MSIVQFLPWEKSVADFFNHIPPHSNKLQLISTVSKLILSQPNRLIVCLDNSACSH